MRKLTTLIISLTLLVNINLISDEVNRGVKLENNKKIVKEEVEGKQYLLLIGIDKYKKEYPNLSNPVRDSIELKNVLYDKYKIDKIIELYNDKANKNNILNTFEKLDSALREEDSLLIYYAGHGKNGFWISSDEKEVDNNIIISKLHNFKSKHVALISDSCFSGSLLNIHRGAIPKINNEYFDKSYKSIARQILTSSSKETSPDDSEFSRQLIDFLKYNTYEYLDMLSIYVNIRENIFKTNPLFANLSNEKGSFLLFKKDVKENKGNVINVKTNSKIKLYLDNKYRAELKNNISLKKIAPGLHTLKVVYQDNTIEEKEVLIGYDEKESVTNISFLKKEPYYKQMVLVDLRKELGYQLYVGKYEITVGDFLECLNDSLDRKDIYLKTNKNNGVDIYYFNGKFIDDFGTENSSRSRGSSTPIFYNTKTNRFEFRLANYSKSINTPMINVYEESTKYFSNWLSVKETTPQAYSDDNFNIYLNKFLKNVDNPKDVVGYRLMTPKEYGLLIDKSIPYEQQAWFKDNSNGLLHEVGLLKPNKYGIYDLLGNTAEFLEGKFSTWNSFTEKKSYGFSSCGENAIGYNLGFRIVKTKREDI